MLTWPNPPIESLMDRPIRDLYVHLDGQSGKDSYRGLRIQKFAGDLRAYEHIVCDQGIDCVVEVGVLAGGSALWFLDRMLAFGRGARDYRVVGVDWDPACEPIAARIAEIDPRHAGRFLLVPGNVCDPKVTERALSLAAGRRCFVIEDSQHTYEATRAALAAFAGLVHVGGVFVVEDGKLDLFPDLKFGPGGGVLRAVGEFVEAHPGWKVRRDLEAYGVTSAPGGFLERTR